MEQLTTKRVEYIDALRGFTMILVIYFHIPSYCLGNAYIGFNDILEWVRMPMFFFISGFLFYKNDRIWDAITIKPILKKKFMVQIIPTAIFMLLFLLLFDYMNLNSLGSDKKGYWYTFVLFEYFVLYIGAETLFNRRNVNKGEAWVATTVLLISMLSYFYAKYYTRYTEELGNLKTILGFISFVKFRHLIFFWFGTFVKRNFESFVSLSDNPYFMSTIVTLYTGMTVFPAVYHIPYLEYPAYLFSGISITIIIFTLFRKKQNWFKRDKRFGQLLQYIGKRTLDIYLLHYFFLPYHILQDFGSWLIQQNNKLLEVIVILPLSFCVIIITLLVSSLLRLSSFLAHNLFGAPKNRGSQGRSWTIRQFLSAFT